MNLFSKILKEAVDEEEIKEVSPVNATLDLEKPTDEEVTVEVPEETELPAEETSSIKEDCKELIMTVLDALENEMIAQGQQLEEDESPDVAMEILYKLVDKLTDADAQMIHDTLSEYYDIELDEEEGMVSDEYQEEPIPEEDELTYADDAIQETPKV